MSTFPELMDEKTEETGGLPVNVINTVPIPVSLSGSGGSMNVTVTNEPTVNVKAFPTTQDVRVVNSPNLTVNVGNNVTATVGNIVDTRVLNSISPTGFIGSTMLDLVGDGAIKTLLTISSSSPAILTGYRLTGKYAVRNTMAEERYDISIVQNNAVLASFTDYITAALSSGPLGDRYAFGEGRCSLSFSQNSPLVIRGARNYGATNNRFLFQFEYQYQLQ